MYDHFSGFNKFDPMKKIYTENNSMSHLNFNEERDYSEENTCYNEVFHSTILHHGKKLNIFMLQLPIYYIQY